MDNYINELKELAESIQAANLGKRGEEFHVNSHKVIAEYYDWRTKSECLFEQYFDDANRQYQTFINFPKNGNGYVLMHYFDVQYPIFKVLINEIEPVKEIKSDKKLMETEITKSKNVKTIFISHASKDKLIADAFVDLILQAGLSVSIDQIFCVSTDGAKIISGENWRDSIKESLISAKINFLIITPNYKESEVCMNEMGAAWVTSAYVIPLIVEPINYKTVGVIQEPTQIEKLLDHSSLDRIRDFVQEKMEIPAHQIKSDRWSVKKIEFIAKVNQHITSIPFQSPMDRDTFDSLQKVNTDLIATVNSLIEEKSDLENLITELKKIKDKKR